MLGSPGALLRAWRSHEGLSQDDVAKLLGVSDAAVSSWETDTHRIPLQLLEALDDGYDAGGCLTDLIRAIGTPPGFTTLVDGREVPRPRRYWGHIVSGRSGPMWAWLRPGQGRRLSGFLYSGMTGIRVGGTDDPGGLFVTGPYTDPDWTVHVLLDEPGWADFGRGTPPAWLGLPSKTSLGLRDLEWTSPREPMVGHFVAEMRHRDRGDPATLRDRLRDTVGASRWDPLERSWQAAAARGPAPLAEHADEEPRPPEDPIERRALQRRLREARGLSQADAADLATRLLVQADGPGGHRHVTGDQVRYFEAGRTSRVSGFAALLDVVYGGFGWTCHEPVRVTRVAEGHYEVPFPGFWVGPVCITARAMRPFPKAGPIEFTWRRWTLARSLGQQDVGFAFCRGATDPPLTVRVPPGWRVAAHMGIDPHAEDANGGWVPVSPEAAREILDDYLAGWVQLLGLVPTALREALGIASND